MTRRAWLIERSAWPDALLALGDQTLQEAWHTCSRGDWLLWVCGWLEIDRVPLVLAACACARTALVYVRAGEERPLIAIEAAWRAGISDG